MRESSIEKQKRPRKKKAASRLTSVSHKPKGRRGFIKSDVYWQGNSAAILHRLMEKLREREIADGYSTDKNPSL